MSEYELALDVLRLACAYGLADSGHREWPKLPLFCEETGLREMPPPMSDEKLSAAERLWRHGYSAKYIAAVIGVGHKRLEDTIRRSRDRFPYRCGPYRVWSTVRKERK